MLNCEVKIMNKEEYQAEFERLKIQKETTKKEWLEKDRIYQEAKRKCRYLNLRITKISKTEKHIVTDLSNGFTKIFNSLNDCIGFIDLTAKVKNYLEPPEITYTEFKYRIRRSKYEKARLYLPARVVVREAVKAGLKAIDELNNGDPRKAEKLKMVFGRRLLKVKDFFGEFWEVKINNIEQQLTAYGGVNALIWLYDNVALISADIILEE